MSPTFTLSDAELEKLLNHYDNVEKSVQAARAILNFAYAKPATSAVPSGEAPAGAEAWRSEPATEKQLELLQKNHVAFRAGLTKGEASGLIDALVKKFKETKR